MRRKLDAYYTPTRITDILIRHYGWLTDALVVEPCAGNGAISSVIGARCRTYDIDQSLGHSYADARIAQYGPGIDAIVSNPPFSSALEITRNCVAQAPFVAMLLRLSFLEPTINRREFLSRNPPNTVIVLPRVSFTGDGKTDSCTCAWMVWSSLSGTHNGIKVHGSREGE